MRMHGRMGGPGGPGMGGPRGPMGGPGMGGPRGPMGGPGMRGPRGGMGGPGMPPPPPPRGGGCSPFGYRYNRGCGSLGCGGCLLPILSAILVIAAALGVML